MNHTLLVCLLAFVVPVPGVAAQEPLRPQSAGPTLRVRTGQTIWVRTFDGGEVSGRVLSLSTSSLKMTAPGGEWSVSLSDVQTIETQDSLKNGARNGAIVGGISLALYLGLLSQSLRCESQCGANYSPVRETTAAIAFGIGVGGGVGALAGLWVDHLVKGRQVVYAAPTKSTSWEIWPAIVEKKMNVRVTMRW
jgi:hypothetical protein